MSGKLIVTGILCLGLSQAMAGEQCWEDNRCVRITGIGHGAVRPDDERPSTIKQLSAVRAAKLDAVRSIAEQVKGVRLQSRSHSQMSELLLDRVVAESDAVLKGVRFVKVEPIQPGIYQAVAELDVLY